MRNKTRFQYVDQLRKINCLQKIMPIENLYTYNNQENKIENNKFIRYRQEIDVNNQFQNQDYLFNQIVSEYIQDNQSACNHKIQLQNDHISKDLKHYNNWSQSLNQQIKTKEYKFKFFFKESNPPPRLKDQPNKDKDKTSDSQTINQKNENNLNENDQDTNIILHGRKYNFYEITKYIEQGNMDKDEKQNNYLRDLNIKNEILALRKFKNLQQIEGIDDFHEGFNKFNYYIEPPQEHLPIDFVQNSVIRQNSILAFDYFRDIGTPSRNIKQYIIRNEGDLRSKDEEQDPSDIHNEYNQQKRQLLYLYFLKEEQLKINKNQMSFFDMANMSMGRITSRNAHMCVRSQKVTKAQYLKLLKKLQKYDLRENETGKQKIDKQIGTEQLEELNSPHKRQSQGGRSRQSLNFETLIQQINKIRKQTKSLQQSTIVTKFNKANFNNEIYTRLQWMLSCLYSIIIEKVSVKYDLSEIGDHLQELQSELSGERLKVLWFVVDCYNQLASKRSTKIDLRNMVLRQGRKDPLLVKYKGKKVMKEENIQPKLVYGFNHVKNDKNNKEKISNAKKNRQLEIKNVRTNGNKTPLKNDRSRTPTKMNNFNGSHNQSTFTRTPQKYSNNDLNKSGLQSTTTKKFPNTAKK